MGCGTLSAGAACPDLRPLPITITPPVGPGGVFFVGPGIDISVASDFVGPMPVGSAWRIVFSLQPLGDEQTYDLTQPFSFKTQTISLWRDFTDSIQGKYTAPNQTQIFVTATLEQPGNIVVDRGEIPATWTTDAGLGQQVREKAQGTGGGLTPAQAQQLTDTERRTRTVGEPTDLVWTSASGPQQVTLASIFSRPTLDTLTLTEVTSGETCDPVRFLVDQWFHAVIVRVTTIDPELVPKTPDLNWYFPDLAVLRVMRGEDLEFRRGIHTPTFLQEKPWQWGWLFDSNNPFMGTPPDPQVLVDWRLGCCGQVFLMALPRSRTPSVSGIALGHTELKSGIDTVHKYRSPLAAGAVS